MNRYLPIIAGLTFCVGTVLASAQDYIDLEAERDSQMAPENVTAAPPPTATEGGSASNLSELFYQVQLLKQEVMKLNGQVEDQAHEIRQLKQQSLERYVDIDRRLSNGGGTSETGSTGGTSRPPTAAQEVAGEGDAYRAAYSLVRSQKFPDAVSAFKQFLVDFPAGRYAPNAHYWLGELYLVITPQDLESSRQSFVMLLEQYPGNSKEADALYKLGKVYFQKGNADQAREYLDRVISEYGSSNSSAVKLARDFITENY
jgi:tol-pal system protein YbgF